MKLGDLYGEYALPQKSRLTPLAAAFFALFAWSAHDAQAATWTVNNSGSGCGDGGGAFGQGDLTKLTGDLRYATYFADPGDTINIACSAITLTQGSIIVDQNNLTINGLPHNGLVITQTAQDRVFYHHGTGRLSLSYMTLTGATITPRLALTAAAFIPRRASFSTRPTSYRAKQRRTASTHTAAAFSRDCAARLFELRLAPMQFIACRKRRNIVASRLQHGLDLFLAGMIARGGLFRICENGARIVLPTD